MALPKIRRRDPEGWKRSFYKPIYARANSLGMAKEEFYGLAETKLPLKEPIGSLRDMTQKNRERLHHIIINKLNVAKNELAIQRCE